ncbi:hypothetical protein B0T26DRAFT_721108 [Lasiosphaeria miniovina]|uniref:Uncharacterized protein n=1 Tax=Lasiosphaeria miniovina TaxID=1954250 RepID=A0AA40A4U6_9PEZI|nr:uncharacterized protein B0T26DRAFT_721108 [Lasiosphaeria miniovina]KAK0709304.1 hypothetical protein B0T26DRAFT_721108 [Lasiosphaeria miniovina]
MSNHLPRLLFGIFRPELKPYRAAVHIQEELGLVGPPPHRNDMSLDGFLGFFVHLQGHHPCYESLRYLLLVGLPLWVAVSIPVHNCAEALRTFELVHGPASLAFPLPSVPTRFIVQDEGSRLVHDAAVVWLEPRVVRLHGWVDYGGFRTGRCRVLYQVFQGREVDVVVFPVGAKGQDFPFALRLSSPLYPCLVGAGQQDEISRTPCNWNCCIIRLVKYVMVFTIGLVAKNCFCRVIQCDDSEPVVLIRWLAPVCGLFVSSHAAGGAANDILRVVAVIR